MALLMSLPEILNYEVTQAPVPFRVWEVLYVIVLVQVLSFVLNAFLFKPILGVMKERQKRLEEASASRERALRSLEEKTKTHAERLAAARRDAMAALDGARQEADAVRKAQVEEARKTAEGQVAMAKEALAKATRKAEHELRMTSMQLGRQIASSVLGREVAP